MNLPNKLTVARVIMIPFFVVFLLTPLGGAASNWIALGLFIAASLTDLLDGKIARKYGLVTNFGKFMDPLADQLLVCAVIAASYWGKFKTTFQMVMVCLMIADIKALSVLTDVVMWAALILTVVSLADYIVKNRDVLAEQH